MSSRTVPFLMPKWSGGSFNIVYVPIWDREWIADLAGDMVHASFIARPDTADTAIKFEVYDGEEWSIIGIAQAKSGQLISANDTGYQTLTTVVKAHWKYLYNTLHNKP